MTPLELFLAKGGKVETIPTGKRTRTERANFKATLDDTTGIVTRVSKATQTRFARADRLTGGSLSDAQLLQMVEREGIENE